MMRGSIKRMERKVEQRERKIDRERERDKYLALSAQWSSVLSHVY